MFVQIKSLMKISSQSQVNMRQASHSTCLVAEDFYTPPVSSVGFSVLSSGVYPSVRQHTSFLIDSLTFYRRILFRVCILIVIGDEWFMIVDGRNLSIFCILETKVLPLILFSACNRLRKNHKPIQKTQALKVCYSGCSSF